MIGHVRSIRSGRLGISRRIELDDASVVGLDFEVENLTVEYRDPFVFNPAFGHFGAISAAAAQSAAAENNRCEQNGGSC